MKTKQKKIKPGDRPSGEGHCVKLASGSLSSREQEEEDQVRMHRRSGLGWRWWNQAQNHRTLRPVYYESYGKRKPQNRRGHRGVGHRGKKCVWLKYKDGWAENEGWVQGSFLLSHYCPRPRQLQTLFLATSHCQGAVNNTKQILLQRVLVVVCLEGTTGPLLS